MRAYSESDVLRQVETPRRAGLPEPDQYQLPDLASVDLSYAGRLPPGSPTQAAVSRAKVNDPVQLEKRDKKWMILDVNRRVLGRMASSWSPATGTDLLSGKVGAIVRWKEFDNHQSYQG
ncbi:MAG: DNA helicase [Rhodobacteraceae bacterium]|nr:MAG: DNA helicase [Paracoccaceae bacterium]